jgi:hypothetical protein
MNKIAELTNTTTSEYVPDPNLFDPSKMKGTIAAWCMKAHGHIDQYPFDLNLYYDLDHLWLKPIDMSIFDQTEEFHLVNPWIHYNKTSRLRDVLRSPHVPRITQFITANGGCVCAKKGSKKVHEWMELIKLNAECDNRFLRKNPEECALAIMLSDGRALPLTEEWSTQPGREGDPMAIHYNKGRYVRDERWCKQVQDAWKAGFLGIEEAADKFWTDKIWKDEEVPK